MGVIKISSWCVGVGGVGVADRRGCVEEVRSSVCGFLHTFIKKDGMEQSALLSFT